MATWSGVPVKDWTDGAVPSAAEFNEQIRDFLTAYSGAWTSYTPAWTAATTNPTIGTGAVQSGYYMRAGRLVIGQARVTAGTSGFSAGSGNYRWSLPIAAAQANGAMVGPASVRDAAPASYGGVMRTVTSTTVEMFLHAATPYIAAPTFPITWAVSDGIIYNFAYEASTG